MGDIVDILTGWPALWLLLRVSMIAGFVIVVTLLAEKLGPFLGGMVASLPLYTGPTYLLLALEHDVPYLVQSTIGSIAICGATPVFALAYCIMAVRFGAIGSLAGALASWAGCALIVQSNQWTLVEALLFVTPIYIASVALARGFTRGVAIKRAERKWTDLPLRAVMVAGCAGGVILVSKYVPPQLTGVLSVFPVIMTSLVLILHPRIGGPATSALFAHTLGGLVGMVLAFVLIYFTIERIGAAAALSAGLAVTIGWNLMLIALRSLTRPAAARPASRPVPRVPPPTRQPQRGQPVLPLPQKPPRRSTAR